MTVSVTTDMEVEGSTVLVFHATWNSTDSAYDRKALALVNKDDLSVTIDEDTEDFNPGGERRTRTYRTNNTVEFEATTALANDLSALEDIGIADSGATDGVAADFSTENRRIGFSDTDPDALEFGFFKDEQLQNAKDGNLDAIADSEILMRGEGVKIMAGDVDPSATPVTASFSGMIEGTYYFDYDGGGA